MGGVGFDFYGVGQLVIRARSGTTFPHCPVKKVRKSNFEQGCEGRSIQRSQVRVVEGGFPCISTLGYIIILQVDI